MPAATYIAQAPTMAVENGVVCIRAKSDGEMLCFHMPLLEFRKTVALFLKGLEAHDARGEVVQMRVCEHG